MSGALDWSDRQAPSLEDFEALAQAAFATLPETFRAMTKGLVIRIEDFPDADVMQEMDLESEFDLLGLFHGVGLAHDEANPQTGRMPNIVTLYRRPILDYWAEHEETLGHIVTHVLIHEIGHHFGLSDADMEAIEAKVRKIGQAPAETRSMQPFTKLTGVAAPLPLVNIDTDMIIPKQYLKTIKRTGLGKGLFAEMRFDQNGNENPDFVLNKPAYRKAEILVTGENFGCGSSREHAPWALLDYGIRCVIATSFADIFYNNCFQSGVLPIVVKPEELDMLMDDAERGANATVTVDLESQEIRGPDGGVIKFEIDAYKKHCMLNGLDAIGLTMEKAPQIDAYEQKVSASRPWA
jgi:3-isopropylmalate/(R)-2-methylmalate dehydratase small subunit